LLFYLFGENDRKNMKKDKLFVDQRQDNHQIFDLVAVSWRLYFIYIFIYDLVFNSRLADLGVGMLRIKFSTIYLSSKYQEREKVRLESNIIKVIKYIFTKISSCNLLYYLMVVVIHGHIINFSLTSSTFHKDNQILKPWN
jgi:hypothetical protein